MQWHVQGRRCCVKWFQYPWLRQFVAIRSQTAGTCHYCRRQGALIDVAQLSGPFANLASIYAPADSIDGDLLISLVQEHWDVFDDELVETGRAARLLRDILIAAWDDDDGELPPDPTELYTIRRGVGYKDQYELFVAAAREDEATKPDFSEALREDLARSEAMLRAGTIVPGTHRFLPRRTGAAGPLEWSRHWSEPERQGREGQSCWQSRPLCSL